MSFTELSHKQLVTLSKLSRQIKQETGTLIKLNDENLLSVLHHAVMGIENDSVHATYKSFLKEMGYGSAESGAEPAAPSKPVKMYRGQVVESEPDTDSAETKAENHSKKKMYRGQVMD